MTCHRPWFATPRQPECAPNDCTGCPLHETEPVQEDQRDPEWEERERQRRLRRDQIRKALGYRP